MPFNPKNAQDVALPSLDGFNPDSAVDIHATPETVFHERTGKVFEAPAGMNGVETEYMIARDYEKKDRSRFFGLLDVGPDRLDQPGDEPPLVSPAVEQLGRGFGNFLLSLEGVAGGLVKETGERLVDARREHNTFLKGIGFPLMKENPIPSALVDAGTALQEHNKKFLQEHGLERPEGNAEGFFFDFGQGTGSVSAAIGMTAITRNPAYAGSLFGLIQKSQIYEEARAAGKTPEEAGNISTLAGVVEGGLEALGNSIFMGAAKVDGYIRRIAFRSAEEAVQEASQQVSEEILTQGTDIREFNPEAGLGRVAYAATLGALIGAPVAAVVDMATTAGEAEGVDPETSTLIAENIMGNREELLAAGANILKRETGGMARDPEKEKEVADILRGFAGGASPSVRAQLAAMAPTSGMPDFTVPEQQTPEDAARQQEANKAFEQANSEQLLGKEPLPEIKPLEQSAEEAAVERIRMQKGISNLRTRMEALETEVKDMTRRIKKDRAAGLNVLPLYDRLDELNARKDELNRSLAVMRQELTRKSQNDRARSQKTFAEIIRRSTLRPEDKNKFLAELSNVRGAEDLLKKIPDIRKRMKALEESNDRKDLRDKLFKMLKTTKVRSQSGRPTGKYTADIQAILDNLREISQYEPRLAEEKLLARLTDVEKIPTPLEALENRILDIRANSKDLEPISVEHMRETVREIEGLIEEGRFVREQSDIARHEWHQELLDRALNSVQKIGGDVKLRDKTALREKLAEKARRLGASVSGMYNGWQHTLDIIYGADKKDGDFIIETLGRQVSDLFQLEKGSIRRESEDAFKLMMQAYGFTTEKQLYNQLMEDMRTIDMGTFTNARGEKVRFQMTKAEMRKRWMELQDTTFQLEDAVRSEEGNAWTQDMINAMNQQLTQEDLAVSRAQLQFYRSFYPKVNEVYRRIHGVDLPFNPNYSPISRQHNTNNVVDNFLQEQGFRRSVKPGSTKSRSKNLRPIREQADFIVLQKHIMEMSHFMHFVDKMRELNAVFGNGALRQEIADRFSNVMLQNIDSFIQDFTRGRLAPVDQFELIEKLRINFTQAVLGAKPALTVKQLTSFVAYANDIPTKDFMVGLEEFMENPGSAVKDLNTSELLIARPGTIDRDIALISQSAEFMAFKKVNSIKNAMLVWIRLGDKGAIVLGGWPVYRYHRKVLGKTHEEAIKAFERATSLAQQSSDLDQLSRWQRGGTFARLFTMFMSAPNQYMRLEMAAIRGMVRGNVPPAKAAKTIIIMHFILPMFFQWVADFGRWDEKAQLRAMVLGSFNGMFILGDALMAALATLQGEKYFQDSTNITEFVRDIIAGVNKMATSYDTEELLEGIEKLGEGLGKLTGLPIEQGFNIFEGIQDIDEGETKAGIAKVLGWPPFVADKAAEE